MVLLFVKVGFHAVRVVLVVTVAWVDTVGRVPSPTDWVGTVVVGFVKPAKPPLVVVGVVVVTPWVGAVVLPSVGAVVSPSVGT